MLAKDTHAPDDEKVVDQGNDHENEDEVEEKDVMKLNAKMKRSLKKKDKGS